MFSKIRSRQKNESNHLRENSRPTNNKHRNEERTTEDSRGKTNEWTVLVGSQEPGEDHTSSSIVHRKEVKPIKIDGQDVIRSVVFLVDGKHVLSGDKEGNIRRWRVEDGMEVGMPMDAESAVRSLAVSRDGKWVVSGASSGQVTVWNANTGEKATEFRGRGNDRAVHAGVDAVDVSPDTTRIATGSEDHTTCVWSLSTGQQLLGPLRHYFSVVGVKFSPDGRLIATATRGDSVRIWDGQDGRHLVDALIRVNSFGNQSLAWTSDSKQLFALSADGNISRLDVSAGTTLSRWSIHKGKYPRCIVLANNGAFIAASADSSLSFWDTTTQKQIGCVIEHTTEIMCVAISSRYNLVASSGHEITLWSLCDTLPSLYFDNISMKSETRRTEAEKTDLKVTHDSVQVQDNGSNDKTAGLEKAVQDLRYQLATFQHAAEQEKDNLNEIINSLRARDTSSNSKIRHLEHTVQELHVQLANSQHKADSLARLNHVYELKHHCEFLYAQGRIYDAAESFLQFVDTVNEDPTANKLLVDWRAEFMHRCITMLERVGDEALNAEKQDEAAAAYSIALSLSPSTPSPVLIKWARMMLIHGTANEALKASIKFKFPKFIIYRVICDVLDGNGQVTQAIECFQQMQSELAEDMRTPAERAAWELDFRRRCIEKLEKIADTAMDSKNNNEAIEHYSKALSLGPMDPSDILIRRSKARAAMGSWAEAVIDADKAIELNPSSYKGYERKHAALHGMGRHSEAFREFRMMLSKLEQSPDPDIRKLRRQYVDATSTIRGVIEQTIRHMPRVLVDTTTGRLYDKAQQAAAFKKLPMYDELRSSMTTRLDHARIGGAVKKYYRYVMFSHRWQAGEPSFQRVENTSIYQLEASPANIKLKTFCELIRALGFQWVWSDTCCIDKKDNVVLQESLVAMFTWYRGSSLTIIYLLGVWSELQRPGDLRKSIWNTRAWTYQEYVAAETVQFYTEDWKPYLGLTVANHKESPVIISEMQQAAGVFTQELAIIRPGLDRVREKLHLASMRQTTLVEDIAYSLLGIFNVAIPVIYGEGNRAVGRFLEHILTGSGDVTILAWTGRTGSYNSCLPPDLTVYNQLVPQHIPQPIETAEMDGIITALRSSLPDLSLAVTLHDHLNKLPSPSVAASRLRLPGIVFSITELDTLELGSGADSESRVYRAMTSALGEVEIKTTDDLSTMKDLLLIHPWVSPLLDQEFSRGAATLDDTTRALRLVARLRQPFGALLLEPLSRVQYRRVAPDSLIMVRIREETPLAELMDSVRMVDIQ